MEFKATARESIHDERTIIHDLATATIYTKGGIEYQPQDILNQKKIGKCTAISLIQNLKKATGFDASDDFQYLLQKKFIDGDWQEGSSVFSALKVGKKYGFLRRDLFTYITDADCDLPYEEYVAKLQAIPDTEVSRLLALCEPKLTGYAQIDISSKENIAHAIDSSKAGILTRVNVTDDWWKRSDGTISWSPTDIDPIRNTGTYVGGHAITSSYYDFTAGDKLTQPNTWSTSWDILGNCHFIYENQQITEAWIPYYNTAPVTLQFTLQLQVGGTGDEVKRLQQLLQKMGFFPSGQVCTGYFGSITKNAVMAFQKANNIQQLGIVGPITRARLNLLLNPSQTPQNGTGEVLTTNMTNTMSPQLKTELISITHTFIAVFGAILLSSLNTLDFTNLTKETLLAFGVAILRSTVKTMWNTYFPYGQSATI